MNRDQTRLHVLGAAACRERIHIAGLLRPAASTACLNSTPSQLLIVVRSIMGKVLQRLADLRDQRLVQAGLDAQGRVDERQATAAREAPTISLISTCRSIGPIEFTCTGWQSMTMKAAFCCVRNWSGFGSEWLQLSWSPLHSN